MSSTRLTIRDLACMAIYIAAARGITRLHRGKLRELYTPFGASGPQDRKFLPFNDAEIALLADHEALWTETQALLGEESSLFWGLPLPQERIVTSDWGTLPQKSPGHMVCFIRAMHAFGCFPGYV